MHVYVLIYTFYQTETMYPKCTNTSVHVVRCRFAESAARTVRCQSRRLLAITLRCIALHYVYTVTSYTHRGAAAAEMPMI